jgi:hypothetical protein
MRIILKGSTNPRDIFDVPTLAGQNLIAGGAYEEYKAPAKPFQPVKWRVIQGYLQGLEPPMISVTCPMCRKADQVESRKGTAHLTVNFTHCNGIHEAIPKEIAEAYLSQWQAWRKEFQPKLFRKEQQEAQIAAANRQRHDLTIRAARVASARTR